jgi:hypothetical protein
VDKVTSVGKTTTLKAATIVVTSQTTSVKTVKSTITAPGHTVYSTATNFRTITTVLPQVTAVVSKSEDVTSIKTVTLPANTVTSWATVKTTLKPSSTVTQRATVVKTTTVKIAAATSTWVTKTSKGSKACPTS